MFCCNHNGHCCEDPQSQIRLTLGDLQRMCTHTKKNCVELYKEGIIAPLPFGDPIMRDTWDVDIGLRIPCQHRVPKGDRVECAIYENRPLNCRLFPFWILVEAPMKHIEEFVKIHPCGACCKVGKDFKKDLEIYTPYKEALAAIFDVETKITDAFYDAVEFNGTLSSKVPMSPEEDKEIIADLITQLDEKDFTKIFTLIDEELKNHTFIKAEEMPTLQQFINAAEEGDK